MKSNDWRHKNVARYTPGNTKILYFFNCLLDGMHTKATGYQIVAAKNSRFSKGKKVLTKKGTRQVTYTITKLNSRKIYYVKARAYKTIGNKKYFGPWSKVKKIRIK